MRALELKVPPPVVAGTLAFVMWRLAVAAPAWAVDVPGRVPVAIAFVLAGLLIDASGLVAFLKAKTTINPLKPGATSALVTRGIYRYTRNPMYLGLLCLLTGWGVHLAHPAALVCVPAFVLYISRFQIAPEERALAAKFGAEYDRYRSLVRRWL
jgi:protein-S-isoprenylcysteine O-methyltransferase Ste14